MILIVFLYFICASMFTISKAALSCSQPLFFMSIRMLGAGIVLGFYLLYKLYVNKESIGKISIFNKQDIVLFVQAILFHIYFAFMLDLWALSKISSIQSAFIYNLSPFIAALFSYIFFNEKMTKKKWIGLSLGFYSVIIILQNKGSLGANVAHNFLPQLATLGAVISSSYGWIVVRLLIKERKYSALLINSVSMILGGGLALISSLFFEDWNPCPVSSWYDFVKYIILIIVISNILFYNLYAYLLKKYTATFLSFAGFMCPFFAAFLGWLFLGESISFKYVYSFLIVSVGLYIFYQQELKQGYIDNKVD